jgi:hypothetical protein
MGHNNAHMRLEMRRCWRLQVRVVSGCRLPTGLPQARQRGEAVRARLWPRGDAAPHSA